MCRPHYSLACRRVSMRIRPSTVLPCLLAAFRQVMDWASAPMQLSIRLPACVAREEREEVGFNNSRRVDPIKAKPS